MPFKYKEIERKLTKMGYSIVRQKRSHFASSVGFEYTLYNLFEMDLDLGFVVEYLYDDRNHHALVNTEDDFLAAVRFSLNDTQSSAVGCAKRREAHHSQDAPPIVGTSYDEPTLSR